MKIVFSILAAVLSTATGFSADSNTAPRAARSVHWGWRAPEAEFFYNEMVVRESTPGSYFMACGWNTGYFGIQELGDGRKVIIFSVWDPTTGDDPGAVKPEDRVELLHSDPGVRIRRFGGEGTGGQCMDDFDWEIGQTNRFLIRGEVQGNKTAYSGYIHQPDKNEWRHLVTFRTRTGGQPLKGLYSFVEDFRRDFKSAQVVRKASFGQGWVKSTSGDWVRLARARFTASGAEWEAKETINAGIEEGMFFLQTGGDTKTSLKLNSTVELPPLPVGLPPFKSAE